MKEIRSTLLPKARHDKLIIKELPDETLIYDLDNDKAHCLNETAAIVWKNCDGKNTISDIARSFGNGTATPREQDLVWLALDQLESFKLLDQPSTTPLLAGMDRRRLLRSLGASAIALPVIVSIIAPIAAEAQSGCAGGTNRGNGCNCSNDNQCASNNCTAGRCV